MRAVSTSVEKPRPIHRRALSSGDYSSTSSRQLASAHKAVLPAAEDDQHPLRRRRTKLVDVDNDLLEAKVGITRPTLNRIIDSQPILLDETRSTDDGSERSRPEAEQLLVLVHEVLPKDSLAGVALKYGITIAELRRANQLWFSDSIHLRKTLYIPVDKTTHSSSQQPLIDLNTPSTTLPSTPAKPVQNPLDSDVPQDPFSPNTVRLIPVTKLSFFPPPAQRSSSKDILLSSADASNTPYSTSSTPAISGSPSQFSPFSAILTAAVARLSLDSSSSDDQEHELSDVRRTDHKRQFSRSSGHSRVVSQPVPSQTYTPPHNLSYLSKRFNTAIQSRKADNERNRLELETLFDPLLQARGEPPAAASASPPSMSPTRTYQPTPPDEQRSPQTVRTMQLEPSPEMKLPKLRDRSVTIKPGSQTIRVRGRHSMGGIPPSETWGSLEASQVAVSRSDEVLF